MAGFTNIATVNMCCQILASGIGAIMAGDAGIRNCSVVKSHICPQRRAVMTQVTS